MTDTTDTTTEDREMTVAEAKAIADRVMGKAEDAEVNAKALADFIMRGN